MKGKRYNDICDEAEAALGLDGVTQEQFLWYNHRSCYGNGTTFCGLTPKYEHFPGRS
jgi:hypothetical protein